MKCQKIIEAIEERFPRSYACDWDNVGMLAGDREREVKKVYIALDATNTVIDAAIAAGADMLLTHHPMIFGSIKSVTTDDYTGSRLVRLIREDISYYAMHTNYDVLGMAELSAKILGLTECEVLEEVYLGEGIGRVGCFPKEMTLGACAELVKQRFDLENVRIFGNLDQKVKRAAISPGSGKSMTGLALEKGAEVLITGDIDHHTGIDMQDCGLSIIDAGHYGLEHIYIEDMRSFLAECFPNLEIETAPIASPFTVV